MSWIAVAVGVSGAYSSIQQGNAAQRGADMQADAESYQAKVEQQSALQTAGIIRRAGQRQVAQANAAYAGAGVKIGEGSAGRVEQQITQDYEHDAYQAILEGNRRARGLQVNATATRLSGDMAQTAANVNALNSVLSSGLSGLSNSGWRSKGPGFSGTQAPAPVEDRSIYSGGHTSAYWKS